MILQYYDTQYYDTKFYKSSGNQLINYTQVVSFAVAVKLLLAHDAHTVSNTDLSWFYHSKMWSKQRRTVAPINFAKHVFMHAVCGKGP